MAVQTFNFGVAIELLKIGHKVARTGWKDMYLVLDENNVPVLKSKTSLESYTVFRCEEIFAEDWIRVKGDD